MGNNKFRLSDMMPNAWFYKLKYMGKTRNSNTISNSTMKKKQPPQPDTQPPKLLQPHHLSTPRKSYYYTRGDPTIQNKHCPASPRKSTKKHRRSNPKFKTSPKLVSSSVSSGCSCRTALEMDRITPSSSPELLSASYPLNERLLPEFRSDPFMPTESSDDLASWSSSCSYKANSDASKLEKLDGFSSIAKPELAPIITKPRDTGSKHTRKEETKPRKTSSRNENAVGHLPVKLLKEENQKTNTAMPKEQRISSPVRKFPLNNSPGMRLRVNSPRIGSKKIQANGRKSLSSSSSSSSSRGSSRRNSLSDSLAIVKSSLDPQKDFKESMVEMIVENDIKASKDLEELLVCYLSLNSDEYHELIIKVFKQIWFDLSSIKNK